MSLFVADDDTIRRRLRLSAVPDSSEDTLAIINDAIARARLTFYRRLGRQRVTELLAITEVATPTTEDEVLRSVASHCEIKIVRSILIQELPMGFMDASGDLNRRWQEEALVRERPRSEREREALRLQEDIEQDMQMLEADDETLGDERTIQTFLSTPSEAAPLPGDSILPGASRRTSSPD